MRAAALCLLLAMPIGCAPIRQETRVLTPVGQVFTAGVGDQIFVAQTVESMPNAFGRADLYGRTRPTGMVLLTYGGMKEGKAILLRSGVVTQSDATTMNSTPLAVPTQQRTYVTGTVGSTPVRGTATTSGTTYIPPAGSTSTSAQTPTIGFEVDWHSTPRVPIAGRVVVIQSATDVSITYWIE